MSSPQAVGQALEIMRAQFPAEHPEINATTVQVWVGGLQRFPDGVVIEAAIRWSALVFPGLTEFATHVEAVGRSLLEAEREQRRTEGLPTTLCPECGDADGWVEDGTRQVSGYSVPVRPCSTCSFPAFWLWKNGHYTQGHSCQLCRERRKNPRAVGEAIAADGGRRGQPVPVGALPAGDAQF